MSEITLCSWLEDATGKAPQLYRKVKAELHQPVVEQQVERPRLFYPRRRRDVWRASASDPLYGNPHHGFTAVYTDSILCARLPIV